MIIRRWLADANTRIHNIVIVLLSLCCIYGVASFLSFLRWDNDISSYIQSRKIAPEMELEQQQYMDYQLGQASGAALWRELDPENRRYGLIIGTSSVRTNIDPEIVKQSAQSELEWIVSGYFGPSMTPMNELIGRLTDYPDFKPEVVVLGIHPYMLKGFEIWDPKGSKEREEQFSANWIFSNHSSFNVYFAGLLSRTRAELFRLLGMPQLPVAHKPLVNPWIPQQDNLVEDYDEDKWELDKVNGVVDWAISEDGYDRDAPELNEFLETIETVRDVWNIPIYVLLMPQAPYMNRDTPAQGVTVIETTLAARFDNEVPLIDLRHGYSADQFFDPVHLDIEGREEFSGELGELFRQSLPGTQ